MNKELKISDKSPFEKIRKFDGQGRSYWTSRELCAALGYSTYQKFSVPLAKAMRSAEADGINVDEHFNLMVEKVDSLKEYVVKLLKGKLRGRLASL